MKRIVLGVLLVALGAFLLFQSNERARAPIACGPNLMAPDQPNVQCIDPIDPANRPTYSDLELTRNRISLAYLAGGGAVLIIGGGLGVSGLNLMGVHLLRRRGTDEIVAAKE
jgi:hypothetical protein